MRTPTGLLRTQCRKLLIRQQDICCKTTAAADPFGISGGFLLSNDYYMSADNQCSVFTNL